MRHPYHLVVVTRFISMVSGGIKVTVRSGRILKGDLPPKVSPFIRIKVGSRLADSNKLLLDSNRHEVTWNQSLSLVFKDETQLYIYLLDADTKIAHFQNEIGVCVLNLQILSLNLKQEVLGAFTSNGGITALVQLEVEYETMLQEKIEAAFMLDKKETLVEVKHDEPEEQVYKVLNLKIKVIEATIVHNTEVIGDMKPYCMISVSKRNKQFKTDILSGKNPHFNQIFIIEDIEETMVLKVELWDKETMKEDDFIGGVDIGVKSLMKQEPTTKDITLRYKDGKTDKAAGTIKLEFNVL